jgi:hypothetical protein
MQGHFALSSWRRSFNPIGGNSKQFPDVPHWPALRHCC